MRLIILAFLGLGCSSALPLPGPMACGFLDASDSPMTMPAAKNEELPCYRIRTPRGTVLSLEGDACDAETCIILAPGERVYAYHQVGLLDQPLIKLEPLTCDTTCQ